MAITVMCGWETGSIEELGPQSGGSAGPPTVSTLQARTGSRSWRSGTAAGGGFLDIAVSVAIQYLHFAILFPALPAATTQIVAANSITLWLTPTGKLRSTSSGADGAATLTANTWYWIGLRAVTGSSVVLFQVDGVNDLTGSVTSSGTILRLGTGNTLDMYYDDVVNDDIGFISSVKVSTLVPTSDNARGANWFCGDGTTTTNLWDAVNNVPPSGVASASETASTNIEHSGGANNSYDANLSTYTAAGIAAADTIVAVQSFIRCGADIATGTKLLAVGLVSNPAESLSASFSAGAIAHGAELGGWSTQRHAATTSPSVARGTSPVLRVNRPETASRVACVDFMGLYVGWRPGVTFVPRSPGVNFQNPGVL